jgi:hypothetical protein
MVSDMVLVNELPDSIKNSVAAYIGCLGGAIMQDEYLEAIKVAGFKQIRIMDEASPATDYTPKDTVSQALVNDSGISPADLKKLGSSVRSLKVQAVK